MGASWQEVRAFWDRQPCNVRHADAIVGSPTFFEQILHKRMWVEPHIIGFLQPWKWKDKRVLEIGCGLGTDTGQLAAAGASVVAVDLSDGAIRIAKKRQLEKVTWFVANAEFLGDYIRCRPFDLIYSFGALHHTPHPEWALREILAYCHPRTEIRLMFYSKWSWKVLWIICKYGRGRFWKWRELVPQHSEAQPGCPITHVYSFRELRRLLQDYKILSMEKAHIFPYKIEPYKEHRYEWVWYFKWMPGPLWRGLQRRLGWHTLIVARAKNPRWR